MRRRSLALAFALLGLGLVTAQGASAGNGGIAPPDSATTGGSEINQIYWIVIGVTAAVFLLVEGALVWFIFRYRRRPGTAYEAEGPQIHGNTRLELLWTAIPFAILVAIIVVTIVKLPSVEAKARAGETLLVRVEAHEFYWEYKYPNGMVTVNRLRVPVGRPVTLELVAVDVAHSWWVPAITGKRDAIPGRTNHLTFLTTKTGTFEGQCAEFCGIQHAVMRTEVQVVPQADFDQWLQAEAEAQTAGTSDLGRATWEGVCARCHGLAGQGDVGPKIAGNATLVDPNALAPLLAAGRDTTQIPGFMPPISPGWPDKQLKALIDYVKSNPGLAPAGAAQQGG